MCNGQVLSIAQNTALFSLIGTYYGGNGQTTFALPDLRGRVPMKYGTDPVGNTYVIGQQGGAENVTIDSNTMPSHRHSFVGTNAAGDDKLPAAGSAFAQSSANNNFYAAPGTLTALNVASVGIVGGNVPHENVQPYLTINWCIALQGIFPSRN